MGDTEWLMRVEIITRSPCMMDAIMHRVYAGKRSQESWSHSQVGGGIIAKDISDAATQEVNGG